MNYRSPQTGDDMSVQPSPKPLVLLVEDNPIQSRISKAYAERLGVEVHTAANCQEAIQALEKRKYVLILMDWRLPVIDGIQCTRTIRDVDAKNEPAYPYHCSDGARHGRRSGKMPGGRYG